MKLRKPSGSFAPQEVRRFIFPITLTSIVMMAGLILHNLVDAPPFDMRLLTYSGIVIVGTIMNNMMIVRTADFRESYGWLNAILSGIGLGALPYVLPQFFIEVSHIMIPIGVVAVTIMSGRPYGLASLATIAALNLPLAMNLPRSWDSVLHFGTPYIISVVIMQAVLRIKDTTQQHIHHLETINRVSRQIMLSLKTEHTLSLLNATIREALDADTYFVGLLKGNEVHLELFYDEGRSYSGVRLPLEGTLSGWVINNQKELFLPDLRKEIELAGVGVFIVGKEKTSLSWMGVPLTSPNVRGLIALGSYQPNAFDSADMELLLNLAQNITLALDNTIRHAQVEEQARLDSLTGVYNHGSFLKILADQAVEVSRTNSVLSLIMLDVDFFKPYNDTYGHLVGDRILTLLSATIRQHIKQSDAVGRWGGEEFVISLPGASGEQASQIAKRISQTLAGLQVEDREQHKIPVPTVSQGIATYPAEADEIYRLIDLADRRLYIAKERGRNQIEPDAARWQTPGE
ncbi:MAG TPA: sensor domain-containing diguanylate cyclase [Anaerolineales bacterium]|nr:sensor domain-containing diguanylate cyclase [Anaerolineales bacterium]